MNVPNLCISLLNLNQKPMDWIACESLMPKADCVVLFFVPDHQCSIEGSGMYIGYFIDKPQEWYCAGENKYFWKNKVTHWMNMPNQPKP
jgi:hypothetical protein